MFNGYTVIIVPEDTLIKRFVNIRYTHICQNYNYNIKEMILFVAFWNASAEATCVL